MRGVLNLLVLFVIGGMLADLVIPSHVQGTTAIFNGLGALWKTGMNGILGQTS